MSQKSFCVGFFFFFSLIPNIWSAGNAGFVSTSMRNSTRFRDLFTYPFSISASATCRARGAAGRRLRPHGVLVSASPLGKTRVKQTRPGTDPEIANGDDVLRRRGRRDGGPPVRSGGQERGRRVLSPRLTGGAVESPGSEAVIEGRGQRGGRA